MPDYTDRIVDFLDSGQPKLGLATSHTGTKLQVVDLNGKQHRVKEKDIIVAHGSASSDDPPSVLTPLDKKVMELVEEIDTEFLWECVKDDEKADSLEHLTETFFAEKESVQLSAIYRAIAEDNLRFKVKNTNIQPRPADQVEHQIQAQKRRELQQAWHERVVTWFQDLMNTDEDEPEIPEDLVVAVERLEDFLFKNQTSEIASWISEISSDHSPRETAFELLAALNRIPDGVDPLLLVSGIDEIFPPSVTKDVEAMEPYTPGDNRESFDSVEVFSIDDDDTREVDDAFSVEPMKNGRWRIGIHIADVAHFVDKDSDIDQEALRRSATIYLPTRTVVMLPERLGCDLASLTENEMRPSMSCIIEIDDNGMVHDWTFARTEIKLSRRCTYEEVDEAIPTDTDFGRLCQVLHRFATYQLTKRRSSGSFSFQQPELKLREKDGEMTVKIIHGDDPSRILVSEMMILYNALAAEYADKHNLPVIYRAQDPPSQPITPPTTYDPVALSKLFRLLKRSRMSIHPQRHCGLGLEKYTQMSSPLRRFQDLVMQRQIAAHLAGRTPPYESQELLSILSVATAAEQENKSLERQSVRFHVLEYLEEHMESDTPEVLIINRVPGGYNVELSEYVTRGRLWDNRDLMPGSRVKVRLHKIVPKRGQLVFKSL